MVVTATAAAVFVKLGSTIFPKGSRANRTYRDTTSGGGEEDMPCSS